MSAYKSSLTKFKYILYTLIYTHRITLEIQASPPYHIERNKMLPKCLLHDAISQRGGSITLTNTHANIQALINIYASAYRSPHL